jgi:hypothetical protein
MTSVLNAALVIGESVSGSFYVTPPSTSDQGWVYAVKAVTGDGSGFGFSGGNTFQLTGLNSEPVRLMYQLVRATAASTSTRLQYRHRVRAAPVSC